MPPTIRFGFLVSILSGTALVGTSVADDPPGTAPDLGSEERAVADAAYQAHFDRGASSVPYLLRHLDDQERYFGSCHQDEKYSFIALDPTVGSISLYLIEAIRVGHPRPHETPMLVRIDDDSVVTAQADVPPRAGGAASRTPRAR